MQDGSGVLVKRCGHCLEQLPYDRFYRRTKSSNSRLSSYCNRCVVSTSLARRQMMRKIRDERATLDIADALRRGAPINFEALSHKTRRDLLDTLDTAGASAKSVARRAGCTTMTVYRHRQARKLRNA